MYPLVEPKGDDDGSLQDAVQVHWDLVVASYQVHIRKDGLAFQNLCGIRQVGDGVAVRGGHVVELL